MSGRNDGNPPDETFHFDTRSVHAGARPDPHTGARTTPIYQTTSYVFDDVDQPASLFNLQTFGNIYSRLTNPTVAVLEERIANLEGGRAACACASGHAAQFLTFFTLLEPGDEFVASQYLYGGSITQFGQSFKRLGWTCHFVDPTRPENIEAAITPRTKAVYVESLSNPGGVIVDLEAAADIAHRHGIPLIVDNTMASPYLCRPFEWGADIVTHSLTKFLGGHGNSLGGVLVESGRFNWAQNDKFPTMTTPTEAYHGITFYETFGDFAFTMKARAGRAARFRPVPVADKRLPSHHRHRNPALAHGAPRSQCSRRSAFSGRPSGGVVGLPCRSGIEPVSRSGAQIHAARSRPGVHLRSEGWL